MLIDAHLHLSFVDNKSIFLKDALKKIYPTFVSVDKKTSNYLLNLTKEHQIPVFIGFHPLFLDKAIDDNKIKENLSFLKQQLESYKESVRDSDNLPYSLCGLGEIGLDKSALSPLFLQIKLLEGELILAHNYKKAVSIHCVKAHNELLALLHTLYKQGIKPKINLHGANLSLNLYEQYKKFDVYLSFGRNLLKEIKKPKDSNSVDDLILKVDDRHFFINEKCRALLKATSLDKILIESDFDKNSDTYDEVFLKQLYILASRIKNITFDAFLEQVLKNYKDYINY